jgi:hypothetical protein
MFQKVGIVKAANVSSWDGRVFETRTFTKVSMIRSVIPEWRLAQPSINNT